MKRSPATSFLASFVSAHYGEAGPGDLELRVSVPASWAAAIFAAFGDPPALAEPGESYPPVVLLPAPRWPVPPEPDAPIIAEAALVALERLIRSGTLIMTPAIALRFDAFRAVLDGTPIHLAER